MVGVNGEDIEKPVMFYYPVGTANFLLNHTGLQILYAYTALEEIRIQIRTYH